MSNQVAMEAQLANGLQLQLVQGDITDEAVDAIVNAANAQLQHGGGVAAAIARAGGPVIQQQSNQWVREHGPVSHDQAAVTEGGNLSSRYVIHVVGPRWGEGDEAAKLRRAVLAALKAAESHDCHSLALPAISTGIFGYPPDQAAGQILAAIQSFNPTKSEIRLQQVRLVLFDTPAVETFQRQLEKLLAT
jgi:putative ATPase